MKQLLPLVFFCCLLLACQTTHLHQQNKSGNISKMENPTGCKLEMDTLFPDTMDYLPYQIINLTDSTFTYGDDYTLEQLDSETGQWTHVNTPNPSFSSCGYCTNAIRSTSKSSTATCPAATA